MRVTPPPSPFPVIPRPLHVSEHRPPQGLTSFPYKQNIHILTHTGVHTCCLYELRRCCYTLSSVHILINNTDKGPETDRFDGTGSVIFQALKRSAIVLAMCIFKLIRAYFKIAVWHLREKLGHAPDLSIPMVGTVCTLLFTRRVFRGFRLCSVCQNLLRGCNYCNLILKCATTEESRVFLLGGRAFWGEG